MSTKPPPRAVVTPKASAPPRGQLPAAYRPPATVMEPERVKPAQPHGTAHLDPMHLLARWKEMRGGLIGLVAGLGLGILLTLAVVDRTTRAQTEATVEAFGQGIATGTALPQDKTDYGDDWGHEKGGKRYAEPKGAK